MPKFTGDWKAPSPLPKRISTEKAGLSQKRHFVVTVTARSSFRSPLKSAAGAKSEKPQESGKLHSVGSGRGGWKVPSPLPRKTPAGLRTSGFESPLKSATSNA